MICSKTNTFIKTLICSLGIFLMPVLACNSGESGNSGQSQPDPFVLSEGIRPQNAPVGKLKAVINAGLEDVYWIDVRTPKEIAEGSIEGALKVDFKNDDFEQKILELDTSKTYYVYCRSGRRSDRARNFMVNHGFRDVYNVTGGIIEWQKAGYPLVREGSK